MKIIISGPSGSGKDTLIDLWIAANPKVRRAVTATTRPPRLGEVNGISYHFYSMEEMKSKILRSHALNSSIKNTFDSTEDSISKLRLLITESIKLIKCLKDEKDKREADFFALLNEFSELNLQ